MLLRAHNIVVPNASTPAVAGGGGGCVLLAEPVAEPVGAGMITGDARPYTCGTGGLCVCGVLGVCGERTIEPIGVDGVRLALGLAGSARINDDAVGPSLVLVADLLTSSLSG